MQSISNEQKDKLLLQQLQEILLSGDRAKLKRLEEILDSYDLLSERITPIVKDHLAVFRKNFPEEFEQIVQNLIEKRAKRTEDKMLLIHALLDDKEQLAEKVSPIVEDHITHLKQNFPKEFEEVVNQQIEQKIKDSQDDIINVITPVLGKLIRKSIGHQFQMLKEKIDKQVKATFSKQGIFGKIFGRRKKRTDAEIILSDADPLKIEEVYVIQRDSGILIGSASLEETMDQEVIAGMFTAIKAFVEDAFQREKEELEMIEYDNYKIFIQNFFSYYIAVAMSGSVSAKERDEIAGSLYDFAEKELKHIPKDIDSKLNRRISHQLQTYFFDSKKDKTKDHS